MKDNISHSWYQAQLFTVYHHRLFVFRHLYYFFLPFTSAIIKASPGLVWKQENHPPLFHSNLHPQKELGKSGSFSLFI